MRLPKVLNILFFPILIRLAEVLAFKYRFKCPNMCPLLLELSLCFSLWALCSVLYLPRKKAQLHLRAAWNHSEGVRGEETNWGQMVSSAGLCAALQSRRPAEFDEQNSASLFFSNGKIWGILVLYKSRCIHKNIWWPPHSLTLWMSVSLPSASPGFKSHTRKPLARYLLCNELCDTYACSFKCLQLLHIKMIFDKMPKWTKSNQLIAKLIVCLLCETTPEHCSASGRTK